MKTPAELKTIFEGLTFSEGDDTLLRFIEMVQKDAASAPSVPDEPTQEMMEAAVEESRRTKSLGILFYRDIYRAMLAAAPKPPDGWRPIDTAPMTGESILLLWKHGYIATGSYCIDEDFEDRPKGWPAPSEGFRCDGDNCIPKNQHDLSHWMPLPQPPKKED